MSVDRIDMDRPDPAEYLLHFAATLPVMSSTSTVIPGPVPRTVSGLSIEEYHHGKGSDLYVSKSGLTDLLRSPYHYWAVHLDPNRPPRAEPTPAMVLGTMTHTAVLEPEHFAERHPIAPKVDRRTTDGKAAWVLFSKSMPQGVEAVSAEMAAQAQAMAASVLRIGPVRDLLAKGEAEVSAYARDAETGVLVRVRPDWVHPAGDGVILADLKTCVDASPKGFAKAVANWSYDLQDAMYSDVWAAATGQKVHAFVFIAVEKDYPHAAAAYLLDEDAIESGRRKYKRALRTLAECQRTNVWPGYSADEAITLLTLPVWAMKEEE